jgi:hypothetical protein
MVEAKPRVRTCRFVRIAHSLLSLLAFALSDFFDWSPESP